MDPASKPIAKLQPAARGHRARLSGVALIFLAGLAAAAIVPHAADAVNADWTPEFATTSDGVREIALTHNGEALGMAYRFLGSNAVGFSLRTAGCAAGATGCWVEKSAVAVPAASTPTNLHIVGMGGAKWLIFYLDGTSHLWDALSTDNGATWSQVGIDTGNTVAEYDADAITATKVAVAECAGSQAIYRNSPDGGVTWPSTGAQRLDDNVGNPSGSGATSSTTCRSITGGTGNGGLVGASSIALTANGDGTATVAYKGGNEFTFYTRSTGTSDAFWSPPYYNGGACPSGCGEVDGGTTSISWATNGIGSGTSLGHMVAFAHNNDPLPMMFQDVNCPQTTPGTTIEAIFLGRGDNAETGGTCGNFSPSSGVFHQVGSSGCSTESYTKYLRMAGNRLHNFIQAYGHTTLCSGVGFEINLKTGVTGAWANTFTDPSQTSIYDVDMTDNFSYAAFQDTRNGGQIKVVQAASPTAPNTNLQPAALTTTSMTVSGFDVDPMDRVVLARTTAGAASSIRAFDPQTLAQQGASPVANGCNKVDGVMAYSQDPPGIGYTGFLDCTVSSTQTNFFKIRNVQLGNPDQSDTVCSDFCDFDLQTQTGGAVCPGSTTNTLPGGSTQIGNIVAAPISWRSGYNGDGTTFSGSHATGDSALIAFAYTDTGNGNVGLWAINQINNVSPDESCGVSVAFGGPTATKELCTWRAPDGLDYMTAVSDSASGLTWRTNIGLVPVTAGDGGAQGYTQPDVSITQVFPFTSPYNLAVGVACTGQYNYVLTAGGVVAPVKVLGASLGTSPWQVTGAQTYQRGITVNRAGNRLAYTSDTTHIKIVNATTGLVLATLDMPSGTYKDMRLDDQANNLYVAMSTQIARYDLAAAPRVGNQTVSGGNPNGVRGSGSGQCTVTSTGTCGAAGGGTSGPSTSTSTATLCLFCPTDPKTAAFGAKTATFMGVGLVFLATGCTLVLLLILAPKDGRAAIALAGTAVVYVLSSLLGWIFGWIPDWGLFLLMFTLLLASGLVIWLMRR